MRRIRKLVSGHYREWTVFIGVCAVLAFYMTWCFSTIAYQGRLYEILHFVGTLITVFLYSSCISIFQRYWKEPHLRKQLKLLNVGVFASFLLIFLSDMRAGGGLWLLLSDFVWLVAGAYIWYLLKCQLGHGFQKIWLWLRENYALVILLIVVGVLGVHPTMLQFRWDGALYEQVCRGMNIHSMSSLGAYAHLAQGYGVLFCLFNVLVPDTDCAMAVTNMIMYLASIAAFWGVMRQVLPGKRKWSYLLVTAVYACSPYTFGMVNYYSLDFATLCLFVCMLYFWTRREWILQFGTALLMCFTKEPAIVSYGALCVGMVLVDVIQQSNGKIAENIRGLFKRLYYYPMLLTGVLWIVTYLFLGGWSAGNGETAFDSAYMADKLKVLYILNFSWIFTAILVWGSIRLARGKLDRQSENWWFVPLAVSTIGFTLFSIMFKTVNHARYAAQVPAVLYMMGGYLVLSMIGEKAADIAVGLLACLMLISSYLTVDPVSRLCFTILDTGHGKMLTTGAPAPGDSMIYNKQMLGMEYAINKAVEYAIHSDSMIIMPMYGTTPNIFDGLMQEMEEQEYGCTALTYWSERDRKRTMYEGEDTTPFVIYEWSAAADIDQLPLSEKDTHCFIYSPMLGEEQAQQIQKQYADTDCLEYHYGVWTIFVMVF